MAVLVVLVGFYVAAVARRGKRALDNGARVPWGAKSVLLPRWAARSLFTPWTWRPAPELRLVERVGLFRSLAGFVVVLGVTGYYTKINWLKIESDHVDDKFATFGVAVVAVPITMLVVLLYTRRGARRAAARRMLIPLGTILLIAGVLAVGLVVAPHLPEHVERLPPARLFALIFSLSWYASFVLWMVTYCGRHFFNLADVHPMLAPLCTIEVSWLLALTDLFQRQDDDVPRLVSAGLTIGGSLMATALACWELAILRQILPTRLKDGPVPRGADASPRRRVGTFPPHEDWSRTGRPQPHPQPLTGAGRDREGREATGE